MPQYDAGEGRGKLGLDISGLETSVRRAKQLYDDLRKSAQGAGSGVGGGTGRAGGDPALSQQRLATEIQKTAKLANEAAVAQQKLATEQNRSAQVAANTALAEQRENSEKQKGILLAIKLQQETEKLNRLRGVRPPTPAADPAGKGPVAAASSFAGNAVKGFLTLQALEKGFSLVKAGAQINDLDKAFQGLAASSKVSGEALLQSLRAAANGTVTDSNLIKSANLGILLTQGQVVKDLPRLLEISRAAARSTGQDVGFLFESLIKGIGRGSPLLIDNTGITLKSAEAFQEYAKSIGKSVDQLDASEKQQATLRAVLQAGDEIIAKVGDDSGSATVQLDRATTAAKNLGEALARKVAPFLGQAAQGFADLLDKGTVSAGATDTGSAVQGKLVRDAKSFDDYAQSVTNANNQIDVAFKNDPIGAFAAKQFFGIKTLTEAEFEYARGLAERGTATEQIMPLTQQHAAELAALSEVIKAASTGDSDLRKALFDLIPGISGVITGTEEEKNQVLELIAARGQGLITDTELADKLRELEDLHIRNAKAEALEELQQRQHTTAVQAHQGALANLNETQVADIQQKLQAKVEAEKLGVAEQILASIGDQVRLGLITAAEGANILKAEFGDAAQAVLDLQLKLQSNKAIDISGSVGIITGFQQATKAAKDLEDANARGIRQNGTYAEKLALLNRELKQLVPGTAAYVDKQNEIIALNRQQNKPQGLKGISALDKSQTDLISNYRDRLAEVNRQLESGKLNQLQRNQLLKEQQDLQEKINDAVAKQRDLETDLALAQVKNAQQNIKDTAELVQLERARDSGRLNAQQLEAVNLRIQEIKLEQQKRLNDIDNKQREADKLAGQVGPRVSDAQSQINAAKASGAGSTPVVGTPLGPAGGLSSLPLTPPIQIPQFTFNISIDKNGVPTITSGPPNSVLNFVIDGQRRTLAGGGTP